MITQNEMHRWTNLEDWSDIQTLDKIDIHLNMFQNVDQLKRLLLEIEQSQAVLKLHFIDYRVQNIQFLICVMDWLIVHRHRVERLGFDLIFAPLMLEDWIIQIEEFDAFIAKFVVCAADLQSLKHLTIKVDLRFLHLPHLMDFFSDILHHIANPQSLEILQLAFIGGTVDQPWQDNHLTHYYDSQQHFVKAFDAFSHLRELSLKLEPLERCPHHQMAYTQIDTGQTCFVEEYLSRWAGGHQHLRRIHWDMYYIGLFELIPIIVMLGNPMLQDLTAISNGQALNVYIDNPSQNLMFYHELEIAKLGTLIKYHAHLVNLKLDFSFGKIQYIDRLGFPLQNMTSYMHAQIVDLLIRPISQNQFLKDLSLNFGETYHEVHDLFINNTTLSQFEFKYCPGIPHLIEGIRQNTKGLESILDRVLDNNAPQSPRTRTEQALEVISPREIHRIDHLLWIRAMPAFILMQRNAVQDIPKLPRHAYELAKLTMSLFIGDLTTYRLGPDVCMHIATFLDFIPDMFQLQLTQGGILRRGMR